MSLWDLVGDQVKAGNKAQRMLWVGLAWLSAAARLELPWPRGLLTPDWPLESHRTVPHLFPPLRNEAPCLAEWQEVQWEESAEPLAGRGPRVSCIGAASTEAGGGAGAVPSPTETDWVSSPYLHILRMPTCLFHQQRISSTY